MAIETRRVRTHPVWPAGVRTRLQPSSLTGGFDSACAAASASSAGVRDSSSQSGGSGGGLGGGGSGTLLFACFLGGAFTFFGVGGIRGVRGASVRGSRTDTSTSNFSFSLSCTKLGDNIAGCV